MNDHDPGRLVQMFLADHPQGVIETMVLDGPQGTKGKGLTLVALVWKGAKQAQIGRDRAEEASAANPELTQIEEIQVKAADAVGYASKAGKPSEEDRRELTRRAIGQALSRLFAGATGLPEELLALERQEIHEEEPKAATTVLPMSSFDLRGPGSSWRARVAQFFGNRRFIRQAGQEDRPATGGQRIFIAHLMLRAERSWDEIKSAVAALATWGDVDAVKAEFTAELASIEDVGAEAGEGRDLPTLEQWLRIGDLITDAKLSAPQAEQLWLRAFTRDGAELTIRHLKEGRPFAVKAAAA